MFVGHFAVAFAAKRAAPRLSLPTLFAAVSFLDILWPAFILLGIEHSRIVPGITEASPLDLYDIGWSHSLVTSAGWSLLFAAPLFIVRRTRDALVAAGCVFSHFLLDLVTHRPDLPLVPGSHVRFGWGLWNALAASIVIEALLLAGGVLIYTRATSATRRMGSVGLACLVIVLCAAWLSGPFGPPPPSIELVAGSALVAIPIILGWAWAIDRARIVRPK